MDTVLVNRAMWDGPADLPEGWPIANAPRPLLGEKTWEGQFRHGVFYAASPEIRGGAWGWEADNAHLVEFIDDTEVTLRVMAKLASHGYAGLEDAGVTVEEIAAMMQLPYAGGCDQCGADPGEACDFNCTARPDGQVAR